MMIRTLRLALLLASCSAVLAQPLYKWTEADGSITFSPNKPEKGVEFQIINAEQGVAASKIAVRSPRQDSDRASKRIQKPDAQLLNVDSGAQLQTVASTPTNESSLNSERIGSNAGLQASMSSMVQQHSEPTNSSLTAGFGATQKQNRCEDLRKRVVSLERRLKSTLTPEDMDNTVVRMSRYQKSYDQFCVQ